LELVRIWADEYKLLLKISLLGKTFYPFLTVALQRPDTCVHFLQHYHYQVVDY